jgi:hypothetical protein
MNGWISGLSLDTDAPSRRAFVCISGVGISRLDIDGTGPAVSLFSQKTPPGVPSEPFSDIVLAQSVQPDGLTLYASVQFNDPDPIKGATYRGLFQSTNGGLSWTPRTAAINVEKVDADAAGGDQTWYDLTVGVDPRNAKRVFIGFQSLWASSNGGISFGVPACSAGQIHLDHHALRFGNSAGDPSPLYVGEDGGLAFSANGGLTWSNLNETIATNLVNSVDTGRGAGNSKYTFAAMQDTGVAGHRPADPGQDWHSALGGDGWVVAVDPANPQIAYAVPNTRFARTNDAGAGWSASRDRPQLVGKGLPKVENITPRMAIDPNGTKSSERAVYVSFGAQLFKSTDGGDSFSTVHTPGLMGPSFTITAIACVPGDANRLWLGFTRVPVLPDVLNGLVAYTTDGAATWAQVRSMPIQGAQPASRASRSIRTTSTGSP